MYLETSFRQVASLGKMTALKAVHSLRHITTRTGDYALPHVLVVRRLLISESYLPIPLASTTMTATRAIPYDIAFLLLIAVTEVATHKHPAQDLLNLSATSYTFRNVYKEHEHSLLSKLLHKLTQTSYTNALQSARLDLGLPDSNSNVQVDPTTLLKRSLTLHRTLHQLSTRTQNIAKIMRKTLLERSAADFRTDQIALRDLSDSAWLQGWYILAASQLYISPELERIYGDLVPVERVVNEFVNLMLTDMSLLIYRFIPTAETSRKWMGFRADVRGGREVGGWKMCWFLFCYRAVEEQCWEWEDVERGVWEKRYREEFRLVPDSPLEDVSETYGKLYWRKVTLADFWREKARYLDSLMDEWDWWSGVHMPKQVESGGDQ